MLSEANCVKAVVQFSVLKFGIKANNIPLEMLYYDKYHVQLAMIVVLFGCLH